jgi:vacuolar-type H+-ATPase subunit F/Vma7
MLDEKNLEKNFAFAIIGEEDVVLGFEALGFKVFAIREPQDFNAVLADATSQKIAIYLVQENIYRAQESQINSYRNFALPVFIPFSKDAKTPLLDTIIKDIRLRATGTF